MRVVGGSARGRRLVAPEGSGTRPTSDRTREAVFNALWSRGAVEGASVLDLYAGSGALGIEALSRGASHAVMVDSDPRARRAIVANLAACGFGDRAEVVAGPSDRFLDRARAEDRRFDLAFCDPPYDFDGWAGLLVHIPADLVVIESGRPVTLPPGWGLAREARYGAAWVGFAEPTEPTKPGKPGTGDPVEPAGTGEPGGPHRRQP